MQTIVLRTFSKRGLVRRGAVGLIILAFVVVSVMAILGINGGDSKATNRPRHLAKASKDLVTRDLGEEPPLIQPTRFANLTPDQARTSNALIPYAPGKPPISTRFIYAGGPTDRERALTCLAAAALYEAGDDKPGEEAVVQVVLNRLRHPAFPKTVCGVVFQGSERSTGCQFTFTCDGSLGRPPRPEAWLRAREIADAALAGFVDPRIGTATHYHTDWVVPYWRDTLTKLAKVGTQIFYRGPGVWGSPRAFIGQPQEHEPLTNTTLLSIAVPSAAEPAGGLVSNADAAHATTERVADVSVPWIDVAQLRGSRVRAMSTDRSEFIVELDPNAYAGTDALLSLSLCAGSQRCTVMGWLAKMETPTAFPVPAKSLQSATFIYRRDREAQLESAKWDCSRIIRTDPLQCI